MSDSDDLSGMTPPAPRTEPFGEGVEGRGARRERGIGEKREGFFDRITQFFHEVRLEMLRVTWPTRDEIKNTTVITLIAMVFFAAYLFGVDQIWAFLIEQLTKLLGGA